jgi:hypothetical protein
MFGVNWPHVIKEGQVKDVLGKVLNKMYGSEGENGRK